MTDPVRLWSGIGLAIAAIAVLTVALVQTRPSPPFNPVTAVKPETELHPDLAKAIRDAVTQPIPGQNGSIISEIGVPKHCYPTCSDYDLAVLRSIPNQIQLTPDLHEAQLQKFREWAANLEDHKASESYLFWIDDMMRKRTDEKDREQRVLEHIPNIPKAICRDRYEPIQETVEKLIIPNRLTVFSECVTAPSAVKP